MLQSALKSIGKTANFHLLRRSFPTTTRMASSRTNPIQQHQQMFDAAKLEISAMCYPQAKRGNLVENYHGIQVSDPYRALEDPDAEETKQFVTELNAISEPFLAACPIREQLREKLTKLWDYEKFSCTSIHGDYFYYYYNTGLQNHSVLYQQKSLDEKGTVFLDPNTFSEDGTTALSQTAFTEDGQLLAYGVSEKGSDWTTVKFKKCTGEELPDQIPGVKFSGLSWLLDNTGLFYSKYPEHQSATEGSSTEKHEFHSLYFHRMGTDHKEDILVVQRRDKPDFMTHGEVSDDGRFLFVTQDRGCDPTNALYFFDLNAVGNKIEGPLQLRTLFDKFDAKYSIMDSDDKSALVLTNQNAPMFKLVRVRLDKQDCANQNEGWEVVIAEDDRRKLEWAAPVAGDKLLVCYMEDVKNTMYVHDLSTGKQLYQIQLAQIGSVGGVYARKSNSNMFISFESFLVPTVIYHADFAKCAGKEEPVKLHEIRRVEVQGLDSNAFGVEQVFYPSKDGTKIPMYIVHRKDMTKDGTNGTVLNGYGGFNISQLPYFSVSRLLFCYHFGGIQAIANLRGGSEYGETWHEAGMRERKQNVFDDFIAAAEFLIREKYTSAEKLSIHGGSNGGLLTAACCQQRPELFGAVVTRVGVLDMLRYNKFTIGSAWVPEFGNPDVADDFQFIYKYSPLHQLHMKPGKQWPATLLMSADHDDRVVPLHTLKYIAQLYHVLRSAEAEQQRNPVLARIEVKAGHGAGKPTTKVIAELVDMYCFLQRVLKLDWKDK